MRVALKDSDIKAGIVPADVLAFWRKKKLKPSFSYLDTWKEEHDLAFAAAKVMRRDVLEGLQSELDRAIEKGVPFDRFMKDIEPRMKALGWWAPHEVADPKTGKAAVVDPPRRLRTIFETNMRVAHGVGQWDRIQKTKRNRPYLLYHVGPSERHREEHLAWHGTLLHVDDPWWQTHFPILGWGCKCGTTSVTQREADKLESEGVLAPNPEPELDDDGNPTGHVLDHRIPVKRTAPPLNLQPWYNKRTDELEMVPAGIDPGFQYLPGESRRRALASGLE